MLGAGDDTDKTVFRRSFRSTYKTDCFDTITQRFILNANITCFLMNANVYELIFVPYV